MPPTHQTVEAKLNEVEAEMRRIGLWDMPAPESEQLQVTQAFGADKLAFEQWLRFIFIPRVRDIIATGGAFPAGSQVSQQAFREWKMWGDPGNIDALLERLREF